MLLRRRATGNMIHNGTPKPLILLCFAGGASYMNLSEKHSEDDDAERANYVCVNPTAKPVAMTNHPIHLPLLKQVQQDSLTSSHTNRPKFHYPFIPRRALV